MPARANAEKDGDPRMQGAGDVGAGFDRRGWRGVSGRIAGWILRGGQVVGVHGMCCRWRRIE